MISLAGKAALITGGSRGIGAATVKMFAQAGADVVFGYHRDREAADQVAQEAAKHGTRIESFKADLGKTAEAKKLVEFTRERLGRVDILVANAGIWNHENEPIEKLTERKWDEMIRVNLKSVYAVVHDCVPQMIAQHGGRIIVITSVAAQFGPAFHSHYAASKGAVISFAKSLAAELGPHDILVNCISPGWVLTDMSAPRLKTQKGLKHANEASPLGRVATPEEIAGPILFAASDLATFVTGTVINVNGGSFRCG
jgi:3-oxoacyl-[acyl-carrier protein] reductase